MLLNPCFVALATLVTSYNKGKSLCWRTVQNSLPERQPHIHVLDLLFSQPEKPHASSKPSTWCRSPQQRAGYAPAPASAQFGCGEMMGRDPAMLRGCRGRTEKKLFTFCYHPRQAARPCHVLFSSEQLGNMCSRTGFMYQHIWGVASH